MSTTTTNFGWTVPSDTDLVKDGAAAIRTALGGVDTSFVDLKGGTSGQVLSKASGTDLDFTWVAQDDSNAIQNAIVDAKGDLIAASAADTPARLAVGTNGQVLTADSTAATGLAWASPASGGGMTLLATTSLSGSSNTVSSISQNYKHLFVIIKNAINNLSENMCIRLNGDTGSNYVYSAVFNQTTTVAGQGNAAATVYLLSGGVPTSGTDELKTGAASIWLWRYTDTDVQEIESKAFQNIGGAGFWSGVGKYNKSAAITSITYLPLAGTWSGGTAYLYGVN